MSGATSLSVDLAAMVTPPTDAFVVLTWDDGTKIGPISYDTIAGHNWAHTYSTHGHYQANLIVYNLATIETFIITVRSLWSPIC